MMENHKHSNQLIHETSPYLLQHAHNPVDWHPWNKKTLDKAKKEDKMILISIGYSACHWCHVMEHESFEDEEVARVMNEHFICIKVDREERPDVDQVYMDAVQTISGRGGWPLNCFALPDGKPFWGATYFMRDQWFDILENVAKLFGTQRKKLQQQAEDIFVGISKSSFVDPGTNLKTDFNKKDADEMSYTLGNRVDRDHGGFAGAPKFPMPNNFLYLLRYHHYSENPEAYELVELTLEKMGKGGIYDQLGGGFSRYSVDDHWHVPHFEKMLYDNAQLLSLYSEAFLAGKNQNFEKVIRETIGFVTRELTSAEGGFFSALDADSEGVEGKFYVWSKEEFEKVTGSDSVLLSEHFGIGGDAYWEDGNHVLIQAKSGVDLSIQNQMPVEEVMDAIRIGKQKLFEIRSKRIRPGLDDKVLTSWNALMLKACVDAYKALNDDDFLSLALRNARFITDILMVPDGSLKRTYKNGKTAIDGFLEDYSFLCEALLALYEITFDEQWINKAKLIVDYAIEHFFDQASGMFFFTSDLHDDTIARKIEVADNVTPSSSSSLARSLHILSLVYEDLHYAELSRGMLQRVKAKMLRFPSAFSNWGILYLNHTFAFHTVVVSGNQAEDCARELMQVYNPHIFIACSKSKSALPIFKDRYNKEKTQIFVCTGDACQLPVESVEDVLPFLSKER